MNIRVLRTNTMVPIALYIGFVLSLVRLIFSLCIVNRPGLSMRQLRQLSPAPKTGITVH